MAVSIASTAPTGIVLKVEQTFNGVTFTQLGSTITTVGNTLFDITDGPFGLVRFNSVAISAGTFTVTVTGFPIQRMF